MIHLRTVRGGVNVNIRKLILFSIFFTYSINNTKNGNKIQCSVRVCCSYTFSFLLTNHAPNLICVPLNCTRIIISVGEPFLVKKCKQIWTFLQNIFCYLILRWAVHWKMAKYKTNFFLAVYFALHIFLHLYLHIL